MRIILQVSLLFSTAKALGVSSSLSTATTSSSSPILISPISSTDTKDDSIKHYISEAKKQHEYEFQVGEKIFGSSSKSKSSSSSSYSNNNNFITHSVSKGNGGPSESILSNGNIIFESKDKIINDETCDFFIRMARETISTEKRNAQNEDQSSSQEDWRRTNSELGEARISKLPQEALEKLNMLLKEKLYPILIDRFGIDDDDDTLTVYDGLILGNIAPSRSQPVHRDASLLTINIALSSPDNDYEGGGTYIEGLVQNKHSTSCLLSPLRVEKGKLLCHSSGIMHAGNAITSGERWVMVLFIISKNELQIARRTHAQGLELLQDNDPNPNSNNLLNKQAKLAFEAGLSVAPNDHILHMGLGQIAHIRGDEEDESLYRLMKASKLYPPSHKAAMTLGKMMEAKRRPRAALRQFDKVLSYIDGNDLIDDYGGNASAVWMPLKALAWDARVSAGRCALLCAEWEARKFTTDDDDYRHKISWSQTHLPIAIERFRIALNAAPGDEYINSMLDRAEELLIEANNNLSYSLK